VYDQTFEKLQLIPSTANSFKRKLFLPYIGPPEVGPLGDGDGPGSGPANGETHGGQLDILVGALSEALTWGRGQRLDNSCGAVSHKSRSTVTDNPAPLVSSQSATRQNGLTPLKLT